MSNYAQQIEFLLSENEAAALGTVEVYLAGTTTPATIYSTRTKTVAANPFTLDSKGTAQLYADGIVKVIVKTAAGATLYTRDNLAYGLQDGPWVDVASYASLTAAVTAIGSTEATLLIDTATTCTANTTVPATINMMITAKGAINYGAYTLTINGGMDAPAYPIFSGAGSVTFGNGSVTEVYPEWWGAKGDYNGSTGTDCTAAFNAALVAAQGSGVVRVGNGNYKITGPLTLYAGSQIEGVTNHPSDFRSASGESVLTLVTAVANTHLFITDTVGKESGYLWGLYVGKLHLVGTRATSGCKGIDLQSVAASNFVDLGIDNFAYGINTDSCMFNTFNTVFINYCTVAALYLSGNGIGTTQTFNNCTFRESPWGAIIQSTATGYNIGTVFNSCTFESDTLGGVSVHKSCSVDFNSCYAENLPDDRVTINGPMIRAHADGVDTSPYDSIIRVNGGEWSGGNFSLFNGSSFITADASKYISVSNCKIQRATYGIVASANTKANAIALISPSYVSVTTPLHSSTTGKIRGFIPNLNLSGDFDYDLLAGKITGTSFATSGGNIISSEYLVITGTGTKINIPITSQTSVNYKHIIYIEGMDGTANTTLPKSFNALVGVGSINSLANLDVAMKSATVSSVTISGMTVVFTLSTSYTNPIINIKITSELASLFDLSAITVN